MIQKEILAQVHITASRHDRDRRSRNQRIFHNLHLLSITPTPPRPWPLSSVTHHKCPLPVNWTPSPNHHTRSWRPSPDAYRLQTGSLTNGIGLLLLHGARKIEGALLLLPSFSGMKAFLLANGQECTYVRFLFVWWVQVLVLIFNDGSHKVLLTQFKRWYQQAKH